MRADDKVAYVAADGRENVARVTAVAGSGRSGFKVLDLHCRDLDFQAVPHKKDAPSGAGYWTLDPVRLRRRTVTKKEKV